MTATISEFTGEYFFLSNFYMASIYIPWLEITMPSSEHLYQAFKVLAINDIDAEIAEGLFRDCAALKTPGESKKWGRSVPMNPIRWDAIKDGMMRVTVAEKFKQNEDLRGKLLDTGAAMLVEGNTWNDRYWGRCNGTGLNILGSILMEVRGYWFHKGLEPEV